MSSFTNKLSAKSISITLSQNEPFTIVVLRDTLWQHYLKKTNKPLKFNFNFHLRSDQ